MGALTPILLWTIVVLAGLCCLPYILHGLILLAKLVAGVGVLVAAVIMFLLTFTVSFVRCICRLLRPKKPEPLSVPEARAMIRKNEIDDLFDRLTP